MHPLLKKCAAGWVGALILMGCEPTGPMAGGALDGIPSPVPDNWEEAKELPTFQLETRLDDPYSVNLWGVVVDDDFYVAAGMGGDSRWVEYLHVDPAVRLRIGERLYDLRAVRVDEPEEMLGVKQRYIEKYEIDDHDDEEFGHEAWVFRLDPP